MQGLNLAVGKNFRDYLGIYFYSGAAKGSLKTVLKRTLVLFRHVMALCVCEEGFELKQPESLFKYRKCTI